MVVDNFMTTTILESHHETQSQSVIGVLKASDGSSRFSTSLHDQSCTAVTSINGPIEVRIRDETIGRATLELQIHPSSGLASPKERFLEDIIRKGLESIILLGLHARSQVIIVTQLIDPVSSSTGTHKYYSESRTGIDKAIGRREMILSISAIVNSISLALLDANFTINSVLAATTVEHDDCLATLAYSFPSEELVMFESTGAMKDGDLQRIHAKGLEGARAEYMNIRKIIETKVMKETAWMR